MSSTDSDVRKHKYLSLKQGITPAEEKDEERASAEPKEQRGKE